MTKKKEAQTVDTMAETMEMNILRRLEQVDRNLMKHEEERAEAMKEFSEERKALEKLRDGILRDLTDHRLGVRKLFEEPTDGAP